MTETPFWDRAREISARMDYVTMDMESERARSHAWWRRLVEQGPWGSTYNTGRVGAPDREALDGIAKLFRTTPERVAEMIAADWYGVQTGADTSDRVLDLRHVLDSLTDADAELVSALAHRLARGQAPEHAQAEV